jgi:hypothetical protein
MGHKGVSKRKLPKEKLKPLATDNHGGSISDLAQADRGTRQVPGKSSGIPYGNGGMNSTFGSKKINKKH